VAINNIEPSIFAFTGHPLDKAVGLQATLNHLDPTVGRWLDAEPVGYWESDANLHRYASNASQ